MSEPTVSLQPVDEARVTILVDNTIDLLMTGNEVVHRFQSGTNPAAEPLPVAEHGFAALITVQNDRSRHTILLDTGASTLGIMHNMDVLRVNAADIEAIVLSHGHFDHTLGLPAVMERIGRADLRIVVHPDAFLNRKAVLPTGNELALTAACMAQLKTAGVAVSETAAPTTLADEMVLVSGEIPRTSEFEKGFPVHYAQRGAEWVPDPLIMDDQCVILNVRGKGLAVITGCSHAGIINTVRYAQKLTGVEKVYAVIGGLHLTGGLFEKIIPATLEQLKEISPTYIMAGHCTGWSAMRQISEAMPGAFVPSNVGTTMLLG
jgi:7,8-dihydropterin-6-yl-methyl-4-(beta-D-ribofuranosyl)aminobenzene 5'-phosphate synthase